MNSKHNIIFYACFTLSALLLICGFFFPPPGEIHASVLKAVGLLLAFGALSQVPYLVGVGKEVRLKHGNTQLSVGDAADLDEEHETEVEDD